MTVQIHGHRGARARWPENSIAGFEYAIGIGVDAIELDIAVTKDDELVISHDPWIDDVAIRSLSRPNLPSLEAVLALADKANFDFDLEIKSFPHRPDLAPAPERFAELVLAAIRRHRLESRVNLFSFDFRVLKAMRELTPEIRLCALYEGPAKSIVDIANEAGGTPMVAPHHSLVTAELVEEAHLAGIQVLCWTANKRADWERLIAMQVDAIITDDPEALILFVARSPGGSPRLPQVA